MARINPVPAADTRPAGMFARPPHVTAGTGEPPRGTAPPRPGRLGRAGAWCFDHRRIVLAGWIAGVAAIIAVAATAGSRFQNDFGGTGQSQQVQDILTQRFPAQAGDDAQVVFHAAAPIHSRGVAARVGRALAAIRPLPSVTSVSPVVTATGGHTALATIGFDAISAKLPASDVKAVIAKARSYAGPGLQVALDGAPISAVVSPSPGSSEGIGIGAAVIIMLLAFGSVVAMGLPILTALAGVAAGYGVVALVSHLLIDPAFGPEVMAMIGLGVGIDYALFIVTRYRHGLGDGLAPRDAVARAMTTAGRAVLFAGTTVLISLLGLFLLGQQYLDGLALGTILAVLAVMAVCIGPFLAHPRSLVDNTIKFPLGLASVTSQASSPLPGHVIAGTGSFGHAVVVAALVLAGLTIAAWLVVWPPRTVPRAVALLALAMTLMFALAPSTRFGYFIYPATLAIWLLAVVAGRRWQQLPLTPDPGALPARPRTRGPTSPATQPAG